MLSRGLMAPLSGALAGSSPVPGVAVGACRRLIHRSSVTAMGYGSNMHDNDPERIDAEKQRNLTGQYAHWSSFRMG